MENPDSETSRGGDGGGQRLKPEAAEIRSAGAAAVELLARYYQSLPGLPVMPTVTSADIRAQLQPEVPIQGMELSELVDIFSQRILPASRHNGHRRFFGYVASPGTLASALADLLAAGLNANVTSWRSAPGPTEVERLTIGWIREITGLPEESDGLFVSGGSMANFCGIAAARDAGTALPITRTGMQKLDEPLYLYMSSEGHHSIPKAAGMLGIGRENVRLIETNGRFQMNLEALWRQIDEDRAAGGIPFCVIGSAGTVNTGAVDPLDGIADIAAQAGLWFHVDACYGGFARLSPEQRPLFKGMERADSVALDPHKWLYTSIDCGCILYRNPARARAVFGHEAEYTRVIGHEDEESFAFWDYGPELSRPFRALKVWMGLQHAGTEALGAAIAGNCDCARYFASLVEKANDFEMVAPVELSIFCFRYAPRSGRRPEEVLDALNERILTGLNQGGSSYLSNARLNGRFALRGCVLNYRTTRRDMETLLDDVRRAAREAVERE